jgi:hypothetical protein
LSTILFDWQVSSWVFCIAVSGAVGGVKFALYTALRTNLKLLMYPLLELPIVNALLAKV